MLGRLALHLQQEGIEFIQFAFRWMNCLLMRELPLQSTVRMWDTYLAEGSSEGFSEFHVYVCAAFLVKWSEQLKSQDFQVWKEDIRYGSYIDTMFGIQGIMIFLQQLPTKDWQEKDVELLLSEAYMWKTLFHNAPHHLKWTCSLKLVRSRQGNNSLLLCQEHLSITTNDVPFLLLLILSLTKRGWKLKKKKRKAYILNREPASVQT